MANRLEGLMVKEVSGVDRAANRRTFLITKREDGMATETEPQAGALRKAWEMLSGLFGAPIAKADDAPKDFATAYADAEAERQKWAKTEKLWPIWQALRESVTACLLDDTMPDHRAAVATCMQQALDAMAAQGLIDAPAVLKAMADFQGQSEPLFKAGKAIAAHRMDMLTQMKGLLDDLIAGAKPEATDAAEGDVKKEDTPMAEATGAQVAPVTKADFDALQKSVSDLTAANEKLVKAANDAEALAKAETDKRETAEAIAKAEKDMPNVPGTTAADLGPVLKRAKGALSADDFGVLEKALVASSAAIKAGDLLKEAGTNGSGAASDAKGQIEGLAKAAQAANPALTFAAAYDQVLKANPALYTQYQAEKAK